MFEYKVGLVQSTFTPGTSIRKDLPQLYESGLVLRTYGRAMLNELDDKYYNELIQKGINVIKVKVVE